MSMKRSLRNVALFAILILAGCSGAQSAKPGQNPETQTDAAGDGYAGIESGSSLSEDAAGDALEVDDILSQGQDLLNQTVTVIGQTPMSTIGDENGVPIGFSSQRGKPADQDPRIRIEIPADTPGNAVVMVSGRVDCDQSGYILRNTRTEDVLEVCDGAGGCPGGAGWETGQYRKHPAKE